jgi:hypothetical protein
MALDLLRQAVLGGLMASVGMPAQGSSPKAGAQVALDSGSSPVPALTAGSPSPAAASGGAAPAQPAASAAPAMTHGVPKGSVACFGANTCKGQNGCAVTKAQIKATQEAFGDKFAKSKTITCAGQAECAAKDGFLSWKVEPTAKDCFEKSGFIFERKNGKLTVKKG